MVLVPNGLQRNSRVARRLEDNSLKMIITIHKIVKYVCINNVKVKRNYLLISENEWFHFKLQLLKWLNFKENTAKKKIELNMDDVTKKKT